MTNHSSPETDERPVEVWHGDRKVTVYNDVVLRSWGTNIDDEMSDEPRTHESVGAAFEWLFNRPAQSEREMALERAAYEFCDKVHRGEARSVKSYAAFKAALALPSRAPAQSQPGLNTVAKEAVERGAAAIAREGFPKGRESARDYRIRLARACLKAAAFAQQPTRGIDGPD